MNSEEEARAVDEVVDRLAARFPAVSRDHVAAIVGEEHLELEGNPIRDFVPVLIEHEARERLRAEGAMPTRISDPGDTPVPSVGAGPGVADEVRADAPYESPVAVLNGDLGGGS